MKVIYTFIPELIGRQFADNIIMRILVTNLTYSFKCYDIWWERHWQENSGGLFEWLGAERKYTYNILELPFSSADRQSNVSYAEIRRKYYGKFTQ